MRIAYILLILQNIIFIHWFLSEKKIHLEYLFKIPSLTLLMESTSLLASKVLLSLCIYLLIHPITVNGIPLVLVKDSASGFCRPLSLWTLSFKIDHGSDSNLVIIFYVKFYLENLFLFLSYIVFMITFKKWYNSVHLKLAHCVILGILVPSI